MKSHKCSCACNHPKMIPGKWMSISEIRQEMGLDQPYKRVDLHIVLSSSIDWLLLARDPKRFQKLWCRPLVALVMGALILLGKAQVISVRIPQSPSKQNSNE